MHIDVISRSKTKTEVIECLSTIVQEDIMKETQHHVPKECRQQLRAQLYQQRENIQFDPILQAQCITDIKQYCYKVEPGNSQVLYPYILTESLNQIIFNLYIYLIIVDSRMLSRT